MNKEIALLCILVMFNVHAPVFDCSCINIRALSQSRWNQGLRRFRKILILANQSLQFDFAHPKNIWKHRNSEGSQVSKVTLPTYSHFPLTFYCLLLAFYWLHLISTVFLLAVYFYLLYWHYTDCLLTRMNLISVSDPMYRVFFFFTGTPVADSQYSVSRVSRNRQLVEWQ